MTATLLSMSSSRAKAIDFSVPLYMDVQAFAHKRPVYESDLAGFIKAYKNQAHHFAKRTTIRATVTISKTEKKKKKKLTLLHFKAIPWNPTSNGKRVISCIWFLATFIIGSVYRGNLKAMLILPKLELPFDNLQQLLASKIKTFVPPGSALRQTIEYLASQKFFEATSIGLGFPKGSPLREKINPMICNLKEFGILDHLFKRRIKDAYLCLKKESLGTDGLRPLDVGDFYGVFCVYLGGQCICNWVINL
ncbi:uncharacterized protein [Macrobrachium rosenbergii]|uniref:uncharacterized protein n=1 Tax=Macrobrachium rosenbergii TaxID=79674 RepID=UPI0034D750F6